MVPNQVPKMVPDQVPKPSVSLTTTGDSETLKHSLNKDLNTVLKASRAPAAKNNLEYSQILKIVENSQLSPFLGKKYYEALCENYDHEPDDFVGKTIILILQKWFINKSKISEPFVYLEKALRERWLFEQDNQKIVLDVERYMQNLLSDTNFLDESDMQPDESEWSGDDIYGIFGPYAEHFPVFDNSDDVDYYFTQTILPAIKREYPGHYFNPNKPELAKLFKVYGKLKEGEK